MADISLYKRWERLPMKKGYRLMLGHGVSKPKSMYEAIKGVHVFSIGSIKK